MRPLIVLLAALVAGLSAGLASATNPTGLSWNPAERWTQMCNDEQSSYVGACVTDTPTQTGGRPCAWGDEDDLADTAYGKLSAGQTTSDTLCLITDTCSDYACPHYVDAYALGGTGLQATLTSDRGDSWTVPYVRSARMYEICVRDPHYTASRNPLDYPGIPGTNGGYGVLTNYTLTVIAKKTTQFSGGLEIAQNFADGRFGYWHLFSQVPCPYAIP